MLGPIHAYTHCLQGTAHNTEDAQNGRTERRKPHWQSQDRCQGSLQGLGHWLSRKENGVKDEPGPALGIQGLLRFGDPQERGQVRWGVGCSGMVEESKPHVRGSSDLSAYFSLPRDYWSSGTQSHQELAQRSQVFTRATLHIQPYRTHRCPIAQAAVGLSL